MGLHKYQITQNFLQGIPQLPYRYGVGAYEGVVAHATAVYNDTAAGERNYEQGHFQDAFVHFFVDPTTIVNVAPIQFLAWGAGHTANQRFVHVELCQVSPNDPNGRAKFEASYSRWVWTLAWVLFQRRLGVVPAHPTGNRDGAGTLWSHLNVSQIFKETDHTDPIEYLNVWGVTWDQVVRDVTAEYNEMVAEVQQQQVKEVPKLDEATKQAALKSIDYLASKGMINSPEYWKAKIEEALPVWAYMIVEARKAGLQI